MSVRRRVAVLGLAAGLDLAFSELPTSLHPVGLLGRSIASAEDRLPRGDRARDAGSGLALALIFPVAAATAGLVTSRSARRLPFWMGCFVEAIAFKQCFALRGLFTHVDAVRRPLAVADLEGGRQAAAQIVSRETSALDAAGVASAAIESLTENASDSVVAPWLWYAVAGLPAAAAYRAVNTLDAMVGYHKNGLFGMPSARLDDLLNLAPARVTAAALALASAKPSVTWRGAIADAGRTPSPNSGWPMAAAASALDLRLEKPGHHILNEAGTAPMAPDIRRAEWLTARALLVAAGLAFVIAAFPGRGRS